MTYIFRPLTIFLFKKDETREYRTDFGSQGT